MYGRFIVLWRSAPADYIQESGDPATQVCVSYMYLHVSCSGYVVHVRGMYLISLSRKSTKDGTQSMSGELVRHVGEGLILFSHCHATCNINKHIGI